MAMHDSLLVIETSLGRPRPVELRAQGSLALSCAPADSMFDESSVVFAPSVPSASRRVCHPSPEGRYGQEGGVAQSYETRLFVLAILLCRSSA